MISSPARVASAISCSREIYRFLAQEKVPLVVLGSLDHDMQEIASIDASGSMLRRPAKAQLVAATA